MKPDVEKIREFFSSDKYAESAGIVIKSITEDCIECHMELKDVHLNSVRSVHGGAIFTLADFTFAIHCNSDNLSGEDVGNTVAQSCSINYLKSTRGRRLIAKSKCIKKGRSTSVYQIDITDDLGMDIAMMIGNGFTIAKK